jgi:hypothetical protein
LRRPFSRLLAITPSPKACYFFTVIPPRTDTAAEVFTLVGRVVADRLAVVVPSAELLGVVLFGAAAPFKTVVVVAVVPKGMGVFAGGL